MGTPNYLVFWVLLVISSSLCTIYLAKRGNTNFEERVRTQCEFTRYPSLCVQTLRGSGSVDPNVDFLSILINKTMSETKIPGYNSNFQILSSHFISPQAQQARFSMDYCDELMSMSMERLNQAMDALRKSSPEKHKVDIQTWLSAVLTFQRTCKDSVEDHVTTNVYMSKINKKMDYLSELCSNTLALASRISGNIPAVLKSPTGRRLLTAESNFPDWLSAGDRKLLQSTEIKANAVVAKDGSGDFKTVSEAIQAANGGRFVIYVKSGTYNEKINTNKDGITLIGDGKYSTIITASSSVGKGSSLQGSATFSKTPLSFTC